MTKRDPNIVWMGMVALLAISSSAWALHRETPGAVQMSSGVSHAHPPGRSWGNYFAFSSSQDLAATGNTTRQIFVFNLAYYDCARGTTQSTTPCPPAGTPFIKQVTSGPGTPDNPSVSDVASSGPTDQWVAFDADGSFTGGGVLAPLTGTAGTHRQIYIKNLRTGEYRRITQAADGDSIKPSVSSLAGVIVFESTAGNLGGYSNPGNLPQVYLYDKSAGVVRRISVAGAVCGASGHDQCPALGESLGAVSNQNGQKLVFESKANLADNGANTGVSQIYFAAYDKNAGKITLSRLTSGNGASHHPYIAESHDVVVFDSVATNLPGSSGTPGSRIVIANVATPSAPVLSEVTAPATYGDCSYPTLNPEADVQTSCTCSTNADCGTGGQCTTNALGQKVCSAGASDKVSCVTSGTGSGTCAAGQTCAVDGFAARVPMICTGDPLQNGTTGNRVFVADTQTPLLYQITGAGDVQGPIAANLGKWFLTLSTSSDLTGSGRCGYQLFAMNYNTDVNSKITTPWLAATALGQIPPDAIPQNGSSIIGLKDLEATPGTAGGAGSRVAVVTRDGEAGSPVVDPAAVGLQIGAPDSFTNIASVTLPADRVRLPPVPVPGLGAICLQAVSDGNGTIDCTGGSLNGDVNLSQDHYTDDSDPNCVGGCREDNPNCHGTLLGPHVDSVSGKAVCNGLQVVSSSGSFAPGGGRFLLPVKASFSSNPGSDFVYCTADDTYWNVQGAQTNLYLTTGTVNTTISDRDFQLNMTLGTQLTGAPFSCGKLRQGDFSGSRLVATLPILDVPNVSGGLRDVLLNFALEGAASAPSGCGASCQSSTTCDDGNPCNGTEFCGANHLCVPGTPPQCDDGDPCNGAESCDPKLGCVAGTPCDDGDPCDGVETCSPATGCQAGTPPQCDDHDVCDGVETCSPSTPGLCVVGTALNCDDGNPCTDDSCDPVTGCAHTPNTNACDDQNACTSGDVCSNGTCQGTLTAAAVACKQGNGNACDGTEDCEPSTGDCVATPLDCDDHNTCTDDSCDPASGCQHVNHVGTCDDGDKCTLGDTCVDGVCTGTPKSCSDGNACNGVETCSAATGSCVPGTAPTCDDGNDCTTDGCDPATGCTHVSLTGQTCNDGNACTGTPGQPDVCANGVCQAGGPVVCEEDPCKGVAICDPTDSAQPCHYSGPLDCDDGNPCTDEYCEPGEGCIRTNNTAPCDDFDKCTVGDHCADGACTPGAPRTCDDGNLCNGVETCDPALGCQGGAVPSCDDGNPCTADACDAVAGCTHTAVPDGVPCNDGSLCTTGDVCQAGACTGTPVTCDDGNKCDGTETCDPLTGTCHAGTPLACGDGDDCTIDLACDPAQGCVYQRVPNFVVCRLSSLVDEVRASDGKELGGRKRYSAMIKRLASAKRKAQLAYLGTGTRALANWGRAKKRIQGFMDLVQAGVLRGRIDGSRGRDLVALASDTQSEINALVRASR